MTTLLRRLTAAGLAVVLLGLLESCGPVVWFARPAAASTATVIHVTAGGTPNDVRATVGTTVTFRNDDATFPHAFQSSSGPWSFSTGTINPGQEYVVPAPLGAAGTYGYVGSGLDGARPGFGGTVTVNENAPAPVPAPTATTPTAPNAAASSAPRPSSAAPKPSPSAAGAVPAPSASPTAGPARAGGTGVGVPAPLPGFLGGSLGVTPAPVAGGPAPNVAPPVLTGAPGGPAPAAEAPGAGGPAVRGGRLPEPATHREYGLPSVLALLAALGIASLLVRLLLAEAARSRPTASVD